MIRHALEKWSIYHHPVDIDNIAAGPQLRQTAIASDRVQPWPQRNVALAAAQRPKRGDKRQLERVLRGLATSEQMHAEREQAASVSIVDSLEGGIVASPQAGHKVLVAVAQNGPAIQPEPGDCRAHPHPNSVGYIPPKVQAGTFD